MIDRHFYTMNCTAVQPRLSTLSLLTDNFLIVSLRYLITVFPWVLPHTWQLIVILNGKHQTYHQSRQKQTSTSRPDARRRQTNKLTAGIWSVNHRGQQTGASLSHRPVFSLHLIWTVSSLCLFCIIDMRRLLRPPQSPSQSDRDHVTNSGYSGRISVLYILHMTSFFRDDFIH